MSADEYDSPTYTPLYRCYRSPLLVHSDSHSSSIGMALGFGLRVFGPSFATAKTSNLGLGDRVRGEFDFKWRKTLEVFQGFKLFLFSLETVLNGLKLAAGSLEAA